MSKGRQLAAILVVVVGALAVGNSSALAGTWAPLGASVVIDSTNFTINIGTTEVVCEATIGQGSISKEASATWKFTPEFSECTSSKVTALKAWTATDVNSKEATLVIPKEKEAFVIEFTETKCKVIVETGPTLGSEKDYVNGKNGISSPSTLALNARTMEVADSPKECLNKSTSATVNANFVLFNITSEKEAIKVS